MTKNRPKPVFAISSSLLYIYYITRSCRVFSCMSEDKSTYPIPKEDFFVLLGMMGSLTQQDYDALIYSAEPKGPTKEFADTKAIHTFWQKIACLGLAQMTSANEQFPTYNLTPSGVEAVLLARVYLLNMDWPHHCAVLCPETFKVLESYIVSGDASAMRKLGILCKKGTGTEQDQPRALKLFSDASLKNDTWAMYELGIMHLNGIATRKDPETGFEWVEKSALMGNSEAMAIMYSICLNMKKDARKALEWLEKSIHAGNGMAMRELGLIYNSGVLKPKNGMKSYIFLTMALGELVNTGQERELVARQLQPIEWQIGDEILEMCRRRKKIPAALF